MVDEFQGVDGSSNPAGLAFAGGLLCLVILYPALEVLAALFLNHLRLSVGWVSLWVFDVCPKWCGGQLGKACPVCLGAKKPWNRIWPNSVKRLWWKRFVAGK